MIDRVVSIESCFHPITTISLNILFGDRSGGDDHVEIMIHFFSGINPNLQHKSWWAFIRQDVYGVNVNHKTYQCNKENSFFNVLIIIISKVSKKLDLLVKYFKKDMG